MWLEAEMADQRREGFIEGFVNARVENVDEKDKVSVTAHAIRYLVETKHWPAKYIMAVLEISADEQAKYTAQI